MQPLKQSTATEVTIGPAVAVGDGFTPVTTLTVAGADDEGLIKHNATTSSALAGTLAAFTIAVDGYYHLDLSTGETDTLGRLTIVIQDDSLILPLRHEFVVLPANVFDSLYGADLLQVHVAEMTNDIITAAAIAANAIGASELATNAIGAAQIAANAIEAGKINANALDGKGDWNTGKTGYTAAPTAASITTAAFAAGAINAAALATDMLTAAKIEAGAIGSSEAPNLDAAVSTRATPAQVNTQVVDVMTVDTIAELSQAIPAVTPTIVTALMLMYMAMRDRLDVDKLTNTKEVYNDAGTMIAKKVTSDDGDVYSEAKMIAGT